MHNSWKNFARGNIVLLFGLKFWNMSNNFAIKNNMTLDKAKKGKSYTISGYLGECDGVSRRFFELGLSVGEKVKIVATSLQKKVFLLEIRGYLLSVRSALLSRVEVK